VNGLGWDRNSQKDYAEKQTSIHRQSTVARKSGSNLNVSSSRAQLLNVNLPFFPTLQALTITGQNFGDNDLSSARSPHLDLSSSPSFNPVLVESPWRCRVIKSTRSCVNGGCLVNFCLGCTVDHTNFNYYRQKSAGKYFWEGIQPPT
jgi:hypothetical protein